MLLRVEEFPGPTPASLQGFLATRIWMVALIISVACWNVNAVTRTSVTRQGIGIGERLQAEKRLWELGYWAGPIDGTFDSASRHALVAFQKVEGRARTGNLTWTELKALQSATRPRARYEVSLISKSMLHARCCLLLMRVVRSAEFCRFPAGTKVGMWIVVRFTVRTRPEVLLKYCGRSTAGAKALSDCSTIQATFSTVSRFTAIRQYLPTRPVTDVFGPLALYRSP